MLELRPTCEHYNKLLPPDSLTVRIYIDRAVSWRA
jgi:hypothetical protein